MPSKRCPFFALPRVCPSPSSGRRCSVLTRESDYGSGWIRISSNVGPNCFSAVLIYLSVAVGGCEVD